MNSKFPLVSALVGLLAVSLLPEAANAQTLKYKCELQIGLGGQSNLGESIVVGTTPLDDKGDSRIWLNFDAKFKSPPPSDLKYEGILSIRRTSLPAKPNETLATLSLRENGAEVVEVDHGMKHPLPIGAPADISAIVPHSPSAINLEPSLGRKKIMVFCTYSFAPAASSGITATPIPSRN